jgi:hypothetical protein
VAARAAVSSAGDFVVDRPGFRFYFPLTSMLLISALISLIAWAFRK